MTAHKYKKNNNKKILSHTKAHKYPTNQ